MEVPTAKCLNSGILAGYPSVTLCASCCLALSSLWITCKEQVDKGIVGEWPQYATTQITHTQQPLVYEEAKRSNKTTDPVNHGISLRESQTCNMQNTFKFSNKSHWLVAGVEAEAEAEALPSSSLSSSLDCGTSVSGMVVTGASGSCSARLFRAKIRWCNAAASWPMSLELAWRREREKEQTQLSHTDNTHLHHTNMCRCFALNACWGRQGICTLWHWKALNVKHLGRKFWIYKRIINGSLVILTEI